MRPSAVPQQRSGLAGGGPGDRARLLRRFADLVDAHAEELALLEVTNAGHVIGNARWEAGNVRDVIEYYAASPERHFGLQIPVAGGIDVTFHEPLGVVGIIVPWNFPMAIAGWGFAPALAAGNTVVLKPAELTPLSALRIGELAVEAGIPPDVFQVISGKGSVVGWRFVTHPAVRKVCFTGSTEVGKGIMAGCAEQVKRVTLELGGKSANVVFADADIELAAARAPYGVFDNAGQDCCARSRILVERSAYDQFMALLEPAVRGVVVGDPLDERTEMGPLISPSHLEEVSSFVPDDAPVAFRGEAPAGPATGSRQRCWRRSNAPHERSPRRSSDRWWSSSLRGRSRGRCHRQRQHLRAVRLDLVPKRRSGAPRGACHRLGEPLGQLALVGAVLVPLRGLQAVRDRQGTRARRARCIQ